MYFHPCTSDLAFDDTVRVYKFHLLTGLAGRLLTVLRYQHSTLGRRAFSVAAPTICNSLPDKLRRLRTFSGSY